MEGAAPLVVTAKLLVPEARPETVARSRLTRLIDAGRRRPLTVVSAPAGYGKTTAIVEWLASSETRAAWVTLDARDNDPRRLCAHLLASLDGALPGAVEQPRRALRAGSDLLETVVPLTVNALADQVEGDLAVVLDDYQAIEEEACHKLVMELVDEAPPGLRVVVASRTEPPLRLARRRAAGAVTEIGRDELRFQRDETERLLNGSLALGLDRGQVGAIDERVDGWPAGLSLVASSLRGRTDPEDFVRAFAASRQKVAQYLVEEVLGATDPAVREFLYRTSILGRLHPALCEAVLDDAGAGDLLAEVRRSNLLVTGLELDGDDEWLVYHELFRELLERELCEREPELVPTLHLRASTWFESRGAFCDAIRHATAAGDGVRAARVLYGSWREFLLERRYVSVRTMIAGMPSERGEYAGFCEALDTLCMAFEGSDLRVVAQRLDALEAKRDSPGVADIVDQMWVSPFYGQVGRAVETGWELWEQRADQPELRVWMAAQFGITLWFAGDRDGTRDVLEPLVGESQGVTQRAWALSALALTAADEGDTETAERFGRDAVGAVERSGADSALESHIAYVALGEALRLRGERAEAARLLDHAARLTGKLPGSMYHALTLVVQAQLALTSRDRHAAARHAAAARRIVDRHPDPGALAERLEGIEATLERRAGDALLGSDPTPAELRVLRLLATDLTLREIASEHLYVSIHTVTSHAQRLYRRLGARTRDEAVAAARERGLL